MRKTQIPMNKPVYLDLSVSYLSKIIMYEFWLLNYSSNVIGNSNDETHFPHKLLLTNTEGLRLRKAFVNGSSANIKLQKLNF